jgi:hypothetical protein
MKEEFPRSIEFIKHTKASKEYPYIFDGYVSALEGVGRFVLGLIDQVAILSPIELKDYISHKIKEYGT